MYIYQTLLIWRKTFSHYCILQFWCALAHWRRTFIWSEVYDGDFTGLWLTIPERASDRFTVERLTVASSPPKDAWSSLAVDLGFSTLLRVKILTVRVDIFLLRPHLPWRWVFKSPVLFYRFSTRATADWDTFNSFAMDRWLIQAFRLLTIRLQISVGVFIA